MKVKVCGLTTADDVAMTLDAGADLLGFLLCPASPRHCPDLGLVRLAGDRAVLVAVAGEADTLLAWARAAIRYTWASPGSLGARARWRRAVSMAWPKVRSAPAASPAWACCLPRARRLRASRVAASKHQGASTRLARAAAAARA